MTANICHQLSIRRIVPVSPAPAAPRRADSDRQVEVIAAGFLVNSNEIFSPNRLGAHISLSRHAAMYAAHVSLGLSYSEIGRRFGRDRTTVARACRRIEDLRDQAPFDLALDHLAAAARKLTNLAVAS